jgi:hypothetical protein
MSENLSQVVRLKAGMPPSDRHNGIWQLDRQLVDSPETVLYVIAVLDVDQVQDKLLHEDGETYHVRTPQLRVREIEVMTGEDRDSAEMMQLRARSNRHGGIQGSLFAGPRES